MKKLIRKFYLENDANQILKRFRRFLTSSGSRSSSSGSSSSSSSRFSSGKICYF